MVDAIAFLADETGGIRAAGGFGKKVGFFSVFSGTL